jgi:hypothetical protein
MAMVIRKSSVLRQATERASKDLSGYKEAGDLFQKLRGDLEKLSLHRHLSGTAKGGKATAATGFQTARRAKK